MTDRIMAKRYRLQQVKSFLTSGLSQRAYCRLPSTPSRKTLAKYLRAYRVGGEAALISLPPRRCPANRTCLDDEVVILDYVKHNSGHGPQRIANELHGRIAVGHNGVHGVLIRHGINRRKQRQEWARVQLGQIVTKNELETAREKAKTRHLEVTYPGELWGQDTFLIGRLKGIGPVYHHLAVDIVSSYAIASLCPSRKAKHACDFLEHQLVPKAKNLGVHRCLLDNGTEFTSAKWRNPATGRSNHPYERLAAKLGIELTFIKPRHAWTNGACERLHQTLMHEFYIPAMCRKIYTTIEELEYDLQLFLFWYNHKRTHQGRRLRGRTPAEVYLSGKTPVPGMIFKVA